MTAGDVVHVEVASTAPERTKEFYARVFGWKMMELREMQFALAEGRDPRFGFRGLRPGETPHTSTFIGVADIDATLRAARDAGGKLLVPKGELPGMGWYAVVEAPGGVVQGLWQSL